MEATIPIRFPSWIKPTSSFDRTPDAPKPFGYKVMWFAVKASDPGLVVAALELGDSKAANWESGIAAAYGGSDSSDRWLFASPPVNGWVLAVSHQLPHPVGIEAHREIGEKFDELFSRLMSRFDDVQFFGSHRVSDFATWARAVKGKPTRVFGYGDGQVLTNFGNKTSEEVKLGFANLTGLSPEDAGNKIFQIAEERDAEADKLVTNGLSREEALAKVRQNGRSPFPDESDVVELAGLWSIDPTKLSEQDHPLGLGLAACLPKYLVE